MPAVRRGAGLREGVVPCIDVDGCCFSTDLDEEPKKNECHRADAQPNTTQRLNRVDCVSQEQLQIPRLARLGAANCVPTGVNS